MYEKQLISGNFNRGLSEKFRHPDGGSIRVVDHEPLFAMLTKAQARQHHTDAETRYKNVDTNPTQTIHKLYTTQI